MLTEIIKDLKDAIKSKDKKRIKYNIDILHKLGVDDVTINILLSTI